MSSDSGAWKAILQNGTLATPGTADTLKYDALGSSGTGAVKLSTTITSQYPTPDTTASASCAFKSMTAESSITVPALLKLLSLYPVDTTNPVGNIRMRNSAERLALRGGDCYSAGGAGVFALTLRHYRTDRHRTVGFRPAFIL